MKLRDGKKLILASASPRRKELMEKLGVEFSIEVSSAEEKIPEDLAVMETAEYLSGLKAEDIFRSHSEEDVIVIGSDTIVVCDNIIYGKPKDEEDAFLMLRSLSGRMHEVLTGVTIISTDAAKGSIRRSFTSVTKVGFYDLSDEEIRSYIASKEPMDKAGAYGIQGLGALFVEKIEGDYNTVVGFPIAAVGRMLKEHFGLV